MKQRLIDGLAALEPPENPLDQLVNHLGESNVAELTGQTRRLIRDSSSGRVEYRNRAPEGISMDKVNVYEMAQLQKGKKRIGIISDGANIAGLCWIVRQVLIRYSTKMVSAQTLFRRLVALLLPICFLWAFVACVSICASHSSETQTMNMVIGSGPSAVSQSPACCPIPPAPTSIVPEKYSLTLQPVSDAQAPVLLSLAFITQALDFPGTLTRPCSADPPYKRLLALRI